VQAPGGTVDTVFNPTSLSSPESVADRRAGCVPGEVLVKVEGELTIQSAAQWRQCFASSLEGAAAVAVDLGAIEDCDTAGLQLLCSFRKTAASMGLAYRIEVPSAAVESAAAAAGLPLPELGGPRGDGHGL